MNFIILIVSIAAIFILILAFVNFRLSVSLYIAYQILIPFLEVSIVGIPLSYNLVNFVLFLIFIYQFKIRRKLKINFRIMMPFITLMISLLVLTIFQSDTPIDYQLHVWLSDFIKGLILPLIIWNMMLNDRRSVKYFTWALTIAITISCTYGLMLTQMSGINPYLITIMPLNGGEFDADVIASRGEGRLFGYIQSTFGDPTAFGIFLVLSLIYLIINNKNEKKTIYWLIVILVVLNILFCGVRSAIIASLIGLVYYLWVKKLYKQTIFIGCILAITYFFISENNVLTNQFSSLVKFSGGDSSMKGSTIGMRMNQLQGAFNEIQHCFLQGKGYSWNGYYFLNHGAHPILLGFESLIFIVLCNSGIIGIILWIKFIISNFKTNKKIISDRNHYVLLNVFIIVYIAYSSITGEYGYMKYFMTFYSITIGMLYRNQMDKKITYGY